MDDDVLDQAQDMLVGLFSLLRDSQYSHITHHTHIHIDGRRFEPFAILKFHQWVCGRVGRLQRLRTSDVVFAHLHDESLLFGLLVQIVLDMEMCRTHGTLNTMGGEVLRKPQ